MDKNYLGDLADIVRASAGVINDNNTSITTTTTTTTTTSTTGIDHLPNWDFGSPNNTISNQQSYQLHDHLYTFPDPFAISSHDGPFIDMGVEDVNNNKNSGGAFLNNTGGLVQVHASPSTSNLSNNIFTSKMIQISPIGTCNNTSRNSNSNSNRNYNNISVKLASSNALKVNTSFGFMRNDMMMNNGSASCGSPKDGFSGGTTGLEIPSPRNSGIKRRKCQAKKVVCIPAAAAANSRQTGEVVPSDLWAWRKYGQKPIKGSPYPRGYYRCSSSKGCSARKQVERSRTDPNMLVITYTSEHNHPWPTQRNALAGSSRSQPSKGTTTPQPEGNADNNNSAHSSLKDEVLQEEEINDEVTNHDDDYVDKQASTMPLAKYNASRSATTKPSAIKEEQGGASEQMGNKLEVNVINNGYEDDQVNNNYRPTIMPETNCLQQSDQDFFTDLVEFEGNDPLNDLLFTQETKGIDPFGGFFDWTQQNIATINNNKDDDQDNNPSANG